MSFFQLDDSGGLEDEDILSSSLYVVSFFWGGGHFSKRSISHYVAVYLLQHHYIFNFYLNLIYTVRNLSWQLSFLFYSTILAKLTVMPFYVGKEMYYSAIKFWKSCKIQMSALSPELLSTSWCPDTHSKTRCSWCNCHWGTGRYWNCEHLFFIG